jgi:hypothetical protein
MKKENEERLMEIMGELEKGRMDRKAVKRLAGQWNVPEYDVLYLLDLAMDKVIARRKLKTH